MSYSYSEDQLIQRSAAELLEKELGWTSVYAFDKEVLGVNGTLGRTSYHEVLLTERFRKALKTLNPWLTDKQLQECVERMTEHMSSQTLMQINEQKYQYIKDGVPVARVKPNGETEEVRAKAFIAEIRAMNARMDIPDHFNCIRKEDIPLMATWAAQEANPVYPVPVIYDEARFARVIERSHHSQ